MNKFTVDLNALDVPEGTKWITQDKSGDVDFWKIKPYQVDDMFWDCGIFIDSHLGPYNPNWREAITEWPLKEEEPEGMSGAIEMMGVIKQSGCRTDNEYDTCKALWLAGYRRTVTINGQELLVSEVEEAKRLLKMNGLSRAAEALS